MSRKQWPLEVHGISTILEDGVEVRDLEIKEILLLILRGINKIEYHLSIASDTDLSNDNL